MISLSEDLVLLLSYSNKEGLDLVKEAIERAGYTGKVKIGMDVAASEFLAGKICHDFSLLSRAVTLVAFFCPSAIWGFGISCKRLLYEIVLNLSINIVSCDSLSRVLERSLTPWLLRRPTLQMMGSTIWTLKRPEMTGKRRRLGPS